MGGVFVLWQDQDLREVFGDLGLGVAETFTNASVLGTGEKWLGDVLSMGSQAIHQKARPDPTARMTSCYTETNRERSKAGDKYECNSCENAITSQYH